MGPLIVGVAALVAILLLIRTTAYADPKSVIRTLRYFGAAALGILTILLALTGRITPAFVTGSMAWGLVTRGHIWPGGWPYFSHSGGSAKSKPGTTSVRTTWLEMALDHESGEMHGTILKGPFAGRSLQDMDRDDILAIYREALADDPDTVRLLETFLDRRFGAEWRNVAGSTNTASSGGPMSRDEALKVLGLDDDATEEEIRSAHRRLMTQNHPDRGGSDYLAAKINQARDVLLGM